MPAAFKKKPDWIHNTGLISVGFWEPLYFQKYIGSGGENLEAGYARAHSDESIEALAAAGVNLVWIHFFKGFGLEFEKEEMELARDYISRAHARGLRVAAYVTLGSLTPETLLLEEPDAQNWFQVNQDGQAPSCQTTFQCFRVRPCYNAEGYLRYMERVCAHALDCGADMIHFDNIGYNAEPDTCHCPLCVAAFREMLRDAYGTQSPETRAAGQARFGHHNFTHVRPPVYNRWNQAINQRRIQVAHQQEWVRFKVRSLTQALARLSRCIERKNPNAAVEANLFKAFGENTDWLHGINYNEQLPHLDYAFSEEGNQPGLINKHGASISRARTFKTARAFDVAVQVYNRTDFPPEQYELSLAENMAFNPKGLGHFGHPLHGVFAPDRPETATNDPIQRLARQYVDFYRQHRETLLLNTRSLARVAVYRDTESLAYNSVETHRSQLNVEQALLEANVPFDLVYPAHLNDLSRYRAVVVPNAECLGNTAAERLKVFVEAGGGLLFTEQTGHLDPWRRKRAQPVFAELLGTAVQAGESVQASFGQGKVAYLPKLDHVEEPSTRPEVWYVFNEFWAAPRNKEQLLDALSFVAGEAPLRVRADGGRPLAEAVDTPAGSTVVHVLNLDCGAPVRGLEISLYRETAPQEILPLSPTWSYQAIPFQYDEATRRVSFRFEELARYAIFRVT